ncbi:MAG: MATE family efflux transporter [Eubacteriales bacterium]
MKRKSQQQAFVKHAYFNFSFWGICSALTITICTLIDALLVGNLVGSDGLAVVNLATPAFMAFALLGVTLGIGGNVLMGKHLGGSRVEEANQQFHGLMAMGLVAGFLCLAVCALFRPGIIALLGADDLLMPLATAYLTNVFYSAPLFVMYHILTVSVRTDGDPKLAALAAGMVIVTNLTLDLVFMKGLNMGIAGASLSLAIAEGVGVGVLLLHFLKKHALLTLGWRRFTWKDMKNLLTNGFGIGSSYLFLGMVMVCFNTLLMDNSEQGVIQVAVFGVIYTTGLLPGAFFEGGSNALSTVVSIFCGERDKESVMASFRLASLVACGAGALFALLFMAMPEVALNMFGLAGKVTAEAILAFRIYALSLLLSGFHMVVTAFWQTIGRYRLANSLSVVRNLVLMITAGLLLIPTNGIVGVALAYVVAEVGGLVGVLAVRLASSSAGYLTKSYNTVQRSFEKYYVIETESIARISVDLEELCDSWEMNMKQSFFVNLIVEELVLNIIKFGLNGQDKQYYIAIKVLDNDGEYILRIRDNVKIYNPFDSQGDDVDMGVMRMITTKATYYNYQRKLIFNYLYLIL